VTLTINGRSHCSDWFSSTLRHGGWFAPNHIACHPSFASLALGGEYGGAAVYVADHVPDGKRGFYTSFIKSQQHWACCFPDRDSS